MTKVVNTNQYIELRVSCYMASSVTKFIF